MKWLIVCLVAGLGLSACAGAPSLGRHNCKEGLCVEVRAVEPIRSADEVVATVKVTSEKEIPDLRISISLFPSNAVIELPQSWERTVKEGTVLSSAIRWKADVKPNQPLTFTHVVRVPPYEADDGFVAIDAYAQVPTTGMVVQDYVEVFMTRGGGTPYHSDTPRKTTPGPIRVPTPKPGLTVVPWPTLPPSIPTPPPQRLYSTPILPAYP